MHVPPGATRPGPDNHRDRGRPAGHVDSDQVATASRLARIRRIVHLMDEAVTIPGTRWRFGLDGLVGLVPVIGDVATTALSAYIVHQAIQMGVPRRLTARMLANVAVDLVLGAVPLVGDLADFGWKSNSRNLPDPGTSCEWVASTHPLGPGRNMAQCGLGTLSGSAPLGHTRRPAGLGSHRERIAWPGLGSGSNSGRRAQSCGNDAACLGHRLRQTVDHGGGPQP